MRLRQLAVAGGTGACLLAAAACGSNAVKETPAAARQTTTQQAAAPCTAGSGFEISLTPGVHGRPTPVAAAIWFVRHGGGFASMPARGWRQVSRAGRGATVTSGPVTLHVFQGPDRTWQVDSGVRCR
jgi:hypothetical protein